MVTKWNIQLIFPFFGVFLLSRDSCSLKSMVIKVPEAVKSGDTVTLSCEYDLENVPLYSIKWYWNDEEFYRYVPKESPPFKAFPVRLVNVDLSKSGENAVTLRRVHRDLTGDYKCEVSADGPFFHTDILLAHMVVAEIPESKPFVNVSGTKVEVGKKLDVECLSTGSWPDVNITWFINNQKIEGDTDSITIIPTNVENDFNRRLKITKSKIQILTEKSQFIQGLMAIRCQASLYNIWQENDEIFVRDDSPKLAQVLGSTLSQSQRDPLGDPMDESGRNGSWIAATSIINYALCVLSAMIRGVFR